MNELQDTPGTYQPTLDMFDDSKDHRRAVPSIDEILAYHDSELAAHTLGFGALKAANDQHDILGSEQFWLGHV